MGEAREPLWPSGFVGSITHTADRACAAVASNLHLRGIGIDFESIFDDDALREAGNGTSSDRERAALGGGPWTEHERATIVFSAKESLYKCLYPLAHLFFDFTEAEVERMAPSGAFQVRLLRDLGGSFARGSEFEGRFAVAGGHVHTAVELRT
jgi:enterobactin synthetase component D